MSQSDWLIRGATMLLAGSLLSCAHRSDADLERDFLGHEGEYAALVSALPDDPKHTGDTSMSSAALMVSWETWMV
jgi:hypothetical protein